jgi:hypothetical protein
MTGKSFLKSYFWDFKATKWSQLGDWGGGWLRVFGEGMRIIAY